MNYYYKKGYYLSKSNALNGILNNYSFFGSGFYFNKCGKQIFLFSGDSKNKANNISNSNNDIKKNTSNNDKIEINNDIDSNINDIDGKLISKKQQQDDNRDDLKSNTNESSMNSSNYVYRNSKLAPNEWLFSFTDSLGRVHQPRYGYRTKKEAQNAYNKMLESLIGKKGLIAINDTLKRNRFISEGLIVDPNKIITTKLTKELLEINENDENDKIPSIEESKRIWLHDSKKAVGDKAKNLSLIINSTFTPTINDQLQEMLQNFCTSIPTAVDKSIRFPTNEIVSFQNFIIRNVMAVDRFQAVSLLRDIMIPFPKEKKKGKNKNEYQEIIKILNSDLESKYLIDTKRVVQRSLEKSKKIENIFSTSKNKEESQITAKQLSFSVQSIQLWWNTQIEKDIININLVEKLKNGNKKLIEELSEKNDNLNLMKIIEWKEARSGRLYESKDKTHKIDIEHLLLPSTLNHGLDDSIQKLREKYSKKFGDDNLVLFDTMLLYSLSEITKTNRFKPYVFISPIANMVSCFKNDNELISDFIKLIGDPPQPGNKDSISILEKLTKCFLEVENKIDPIIFQSPAMTKKNPIKSLIPEHSTTFDGKIKNGSSSEFEWKRSDGKWISNPDEAAKSFFYDRIINPNEKNTKETISENLLVATHSIIKSYKNPLKFQELATSAIPSSLNSLDSLCRSLLHQSFFVGKRNDNLELVMKIIENLFKIDSTLSTSISLITRSSWLQRSELFRAFEVAIESMKNLSTSKSQEENINRIKILIPQLVSNAFLLTSERIVATKILMKIEQEIDEKTKKIMNSSTSINEAPILNNENFIDTKQIDLSRKISNFSNEWIQYPDNHNAKFLHHLKKRTGIPNKFVIKTDILSLRNGEVKSDGIFSKFVVVEPEELINTKKYPNIVCLHGLPHHISSSSVQAFFEKLTGSKIIKIELFRSRDPISLQVDNLLKKLKLEEDMKNIKKNLDSLKSTTSKASNNNDDDSSSRQLSSLFTPVLTDREVSMKKKKMSIANSQSTTNQKITEILDLISDIENTDASLFTSKNQMNKENGTKNELAGKSSEYFKNRIGSIIPELLRLRNIRKEIISRLETANDNIQVSWAKLNAERKKYDLKALSWPKSESDFNILSGYENYFSCLSINSSSPFGKFLEVAFGGKNTDTDFEDIDFYERIIDEPVEDLIRSILGDSTPIPQATLTSLNETKIKLNTLKNLWYETKKYCNLWGKAQLAFNQQESAGFALDDEILEILTHLRQIKQNMSSFYDASIDNGSKENEIESDFDDEDDIWDPIGNDIDENQDTLLHQGQQRNNDTIDTNDDDNDDEGKVEEGSYKKYSENDFSSTAKNQFKLFESISENKKKKDQTMMTIKDILHLEPPNATHAFIEFSDKQAVDLLLGPAIRAFGMSVVYNKLTNSFYDPQPIKLHGKSSKSNNSAQLEGSAEQIQHKMTEGLLSTELEVHKDLSSPELTRTNYLAEPANENSNDDIVPLINQDSSTQNENNKDKKMKNNDIENDSRMTISFSPIAQKKELLLYGLPLGMYQNELIESLSKVLSCDPKSKFWIAQIPKKQQNIKISRPDKIKDSNELICDGSCEIIFPNHLQARRAFDALNEKLLFGEAILVNWNAPKKLI